MAVSEPTVTQLDALRLTNAVRQRLVDFAADDNFTRDERLAAICRRLWEGPPQLGGLLSDLWVEGAFPTTVSDQSLHSLVQQGVFNSDLAAQLDRTGAVPRNRPLYSHQVEAMTDARSAHPKGERPAIVVTAGTGAGKTESFLLPILNDLYTHDTQGATGAKCLILYPMNALVNDQVDRLYDWLQGQTRVTIFHFTSETPENKRRADHDGVPMWDACRIRTRQEARGLETRDGQPLDQTHRGRIPDIVITSYSMLEYMLCRPQDAVFFGPALRAIVLDEAHLYTGTLAAEITLLLRRLLIRCGVSSSDVLQIATSATLGTGDVQELKQFAATLFTKEDRLVKVIEGKPMRVPLDTPAPPAATPTASALANLTWLDQPLVVMDDNATPTLAVDEALCDRLRTQLPLLVADDTVRKAPHQEQRPAILLQQTLAAAPLIQAVESVLWNRKRLRLHDVAEHVWGSCTAETVRATIMLLQLGASARCHPTDYPLVPHRIHLLARASDGLVVCLNKDCNGASDGKLSPLGTVSATSQDHCPHCGDAVMSLYRCRNCGQWMLAGISQGNDGRLHPAPLASPHVKCYTLREPCEKGTTLNPKTGEESGAGAFGVPVALINACPTCGSTQEDFASFASGAPLTLAILAETVLAELPPYPSPSGGNVWLPGRGRRMLAFSDSRQEAARLGPRLTRQHETQLIRTAIIQSMGQNVAADDAVMDDLRLEIERLEAELAQSSLTAPQRQSREKRLRTARQELAEATVGGSIVDWAANLKREGLLAQVLDPEIGTKQYAHPHTPKGQRDWSQHDWEANTKEIHKRAQTFLAREFASPLRRAISAETLGLAEVTYPGLDTLPAPSKFLGILPHEQARQLLKECWSAFLHALCDTLRSDGAITLGDEQEDTGYQFGGVLLGRWCALDQERSSALIRFVGVTTRQRRRGFATAVLRSCGLAEQDAEQKAVEMLSVAFEQLLNRATPLDQVPDSADLPWLQRGVKQTKQGPPADALRLLFPGLGLRRPQQLYQCTTTGHVWCRTVLGCAPESGGTGTLKEVSEEELDRDPRLARQRREYRSSPVFRIGLWAEEHSAQLSPQENRRLQDLFKAGIRNILSATTTLELGIDIGGLSAVLMGNVPPGKANYLQRAGRAGRRADGSSIVVTFARPRPFDQQVFQGIGEYLDRPLHRPLVFLDRARVVRRHFHSFLLGQFFHDISPTDLHVGAMNAFGSMGRFCGVSLPPYWKDGDKPTADQPVPLLPPNTAASLSWWNPALQSPGLEAQFLSYLFWLRDWCESDLRETAKMLFHNTGVEAEVSDWTKLLQSVVEAFGAAIHDWRREYDNLLLSWYVSEPKTQSNAIRYQLSLLHELTVIEALADKQFLPHYSFPIGIHKLRVIAPDERREGKIREEDQYRLERSSLLALREYVPGSQLLVGGKLVSSRGLLKHWTGADLNASMGLRGHYCTCMNDHFYYWVSAPSAGCPICGAPPKQAPQDLLFPQHGFSSAAWDPPKWSNDVESVGIAETATITFTQHGSAGTELSKIDFGDVRGLSTRYRENGELLVYNSGGSAKLGELGKGFAICLKCGYADSENDFGKGKIRLPKEFETHAPLTATLPWAICWKNNESPIIRNQVLAASETTDVLLIDFSACLGAYASNASVVTTLGYALQRAGAQLLELDSRELGVLVVPAGEQGFGLGVVLYDSVPGGAGHVRELMDRKRDWLTTARSVMFVNEAHHARCETACLNCLLSYSAQMVAAQNLFQRRLAIEVLDALLDERALPAPPAKIPTQTAAHETTLPPLPSNDERLQRAEKRRQGRKS